MLGNGRERFRLPLKKQEFTRKKNGHDDPLAKKVIWITRGFSQCPAGSLTAARPRRVKPRKWVLVPTSLFSFVETTKLELGKAATEPRGPGNHSSAQPTWELWGASWGGGWEHR